MAQQITKQTLIGEMLQMDMGIAAILMAAGMHCVGCPSSAGETIEEAAMVHGIDCDDLMEEITTYLQSLA
mgnify:CR=1 FL=1